MLKKENDVFNKYGVVSGGGLKTFLDACGLVTQGTALETSQNVIKLQNLTTFNWKSRNRQIRVNCKESVMLSIEKGTKLRHILNGKGDPTREYSFLIDDFSDLIDVIYVLKNIQSN